MEIRNILLVSERKTDLYCTEVIPDDPSGALCVFVHGFCAERTEGGRFVECAKLLADNGVRSIMMDQSGCGESKEPFENYCLKNSCADIKTCVDYMFDHYSIDESNLMMVGYSMGGRITSIYTKECDMRFRSIGLWAAAICDADELKEFMYDKEGNSLYEAAKKNGYAEYYNFFDGRILHLSKDFYEGFVEHSSVEDLKQYKGNVIIVQGEGDITVQPFVAKRAYDSLTTEGNRKLVMIPEANHGFGLWDNRMGQSAILVGETAEFLLRNLKTA